MNSESKIKSVNMETMQAMDSGDDQLVDFGLINLREQLLVPEPKHREAYLKLKATTPARLGIWRAGPRYLTSTQLRFRADHALAQDAVFTCVSKEYLKEWGLLEVTSRCRDKEEYLTRPDLGRQFDEQNREIIRKNCQFRPTVQIIIIEGLSSTAIEVNARDTYEVLLQGLQEYGLNVGTPFFVRNGRVPAMDTVSELLEAEVTAALVGERPGLATAESLSCYISYQASAKKPESARTVLSNIHKMGTPAVEAGAHLADIIKKILDQQVSGIGLKL
jgi:ethanolamine ammonia-lyase small subunit